MTNNVESSDEKNEEFETLYREQFRLVYNYIRHHINNIEDAEDLTADVFTRAYRYWGSYSTERGSRGEWLGGIARNIVKTYLRKKAIGLQTTEVSEIASDTDIEDNYIREDYIRLVFEQINTLSQRQRELIMMKFSRDLSNKEIADATGMSVDNVGVTLHRGIKKLKTNLRNG
ncbi:DNA-directed RNA polymerase sigma-70 factor [Clostridia bacterium]|nr:DNA-directed RNA polymerase sigma-70 factor [Clostridia bacterium]